MAYKQVPGYKGHMSGSQSRIDRIVIHATVSPCVPGGAANNARYFQSPNAGGLAHFVVDPSEIIQCCQENVVCWHAPPNQNSIGIELCDPQTGDVSRWKDQNHGTMLWRARQLVSDLCARHSVPKVFVNAADLKAGKRGVTTHFEVSNAFHESSHSDPGPGFGPSMAYLLSNPAAVAAAHPYPSDIHGPGWLHRGMKHNAVSQLKSRFHMPVSNLFDDALNAKIRAFQKEHHLGVDGIVGPQTWAQAWK